jgi:hypothetical protein
MLKREFVTMVEGFLIEFRGGNIAASTQKGTEKEREREFY